MGGLPAGWEWKRLGDVCNIQGGFAFKSGDYKEDGIPLLRISNISDDCVSFDDNTVYLDRKFESIFKEFVVKKGDIVVALSGATTGKYGKYHLNTSALLNQRVARVEIKKELGLNEKFLYFFISKLRDRIFQKACGVAQPNISTKEIENFKIPLPPLYAQRQIVAVLEQLGVVKRQRQEADALTGALLQSVFYEMFGDPVRNELGWDIVTLESVCTKITDGTHVTPSYIETGIPFLSVKNLTKGYLDLDDVKYISESEHRYFVKRCKPEKGDILYTKVGTYGKADVVNVDTEFSIFVSLALLKPIHEKIDSYYLKFILNTPHVKRQADNRIRGIGVPDLHLIEIKQFKIPLPPLALQQQFARIVEKVERIRERQAESGKEIEALSEGLMTRAFGRELTA